MNVHLQRFWATLCSLDPKIGPDTPYQVWYFGNTREMAQELAELVLSGQKTATASLAAVNELKPDEAPVEGGFSVVTDFDGLPLCVIRTTEIRHLPFDEVDAEFAFDEGEGDRSLEDWRVGHMRYFSREAAELGIHFDERSLVCCERFELLFPK
jgi:uncharacterized protein YhfF